MNNNIKPDFVFETSWEVCNRIGGIYTVLSTRAKTMQKYCKKNILFIGPDLWLKKNNHLFKETTSIHGKWLKKACVEEHLPIRIGKWNIPGRPTVVLIDYKILFENKNLFYKEFWDSYQVNSLYGYGDYDEACLFAIAAAKVMESYYNFYLKEKANVIAHFNEWTTGMGLLYLKQYVPNIATLFTTHATTVGRSIAGNNKPLYNHFSNYNGDQMAQELNVISKHSVEKSAAIQADCFTTVSDFTAKECAQLLHKVDIVTPNGFENDFVPKAAKYKEERNKARQLLLKVANTLWGTSINEKAYLIAITGRAEFKNKGIDVFLESIKKLQTTYKGKKEIVAFVIIPSDIYSFRADLMQALKKEENSKNPLIEPALSHWLKNPEQDAIYNKIKTLNFTTTQKENVRILFIPSYLNGDDGLFNKQYYELLIGMDLTIFPSYYEPWGYTPLESIAFGIPTITTDLSGFGLWVNKAVEQPDIIKDGVEVIHRTDSNHEEVVEQVVETITKHSKLRCLQAQKLSIKTKKLAKKALWKEFFPSYERAYSLALQTRNKRTLNTL